MVILAKKMQELISIVNTSATQTYFHSYNLFVKENRIVNLSEKFLSVLTLNIESNTTNLQKKKFVIMKKHL